ncbi:MAG TPA: hypothetical protein VK714_00190 [Myxococcota bacterium]|nr:hypothetical protein [Myxococcota bacterium]
MEQTFLGLTPLQIQGCAAILSLLLTASLVIATFVYVRLTRRIVAASERSLQHVVAIADRERLSEGAILHAWIVSTGASLAEMGAANLVDLAVRQSLPERLPGSGLPPELLMRCAQGISGELLLEVTASLHWIEKGAGVLSEMRVDSPRPGFEELKTKAAEAHGAFETALQCVNRCRELMAPHFHASAGTEKVAVGPRNGAAQ